MPGDNVAVARFEQPDANNSTPNVNGMSVNRLGIFESSFDMNPIANMGVPNGYSSLLIVVEYTALGILLLIPTSGSSAPPLASSMELQFSISSGRSPPIFCRNHFVGIGSYLRHGTINQTAAIPIDIVIPNACNAGVLLKPSKPNESRVLNADKPTASHAAWRV